MTLPINSVQLETNLRRILALLEEGSRMDAIEEIECMIDELDTDEPDCDYALSENQALFVKEAMLQDMAINYSYSGRGMYGDVCPSVSVDDGDDFVTTAATAQDGMGQGIVIYARH
ncbi:MAG: hypothetical protein RBJ76_13240 [Stenomitos frigidus ULC029]